MTKNLGNRKTRYAHQIIADTGSNKPFEMREVEFSVVYDGPTPECDLYCYRSTILNGEFAGMIIVSDNVGDIQGDVDYDLMDASRKLFAATLTTVLA